MRWNQGRSHVDRLIADGELQRVPANREHADQLIVQARKDLASAKLLLESNPKRAYESVYDAARMALTAVGALPNTPKSLDHGSCHRERAPPVQTLPGGAVGQRLTRQYGRHAELAAIIRFGVLHQSGGFGNS
jgi:hypothetical protein